MTSVKEGLPSPAPRIMPEVEAFWQAANEHRLILPKCKYCETIIWFPRPFCPSCASTEVTWVESSGRGVIYSFTICRRSMAFLPEYRSVANYVLAYVELDEGPRIMTNIVDCAPDSLRIGQPVGVVFHDTGQGTALPRFRPRS